MAPCTQVLLRTQVITRVSIVYKGKEQLLQLHCHHVRHVLKPPHTRDFWEVHRLRETPFPLVWVRAPRDPRTCGLPPFKASITISESSQLPSISQLSHSHPISLLCLRIAIAQSQELHAVSKNAQCNLKIVQIPRLCGTYIHDHFRGGYF